MKYILPLSLRNPLELKGARSRSRRRGRRRRRMRRRRRNRDEMGGEVPTCQLAAGRSR